MILCCIKKYFNTFYVLKFRWYAAILESTGAAIASASAMFTAGIDQHDAFMHTPLHYAAEQGHVGVVKLLIEAGKGFSINFLIDLQELHKSLMNFST